MNLFAQIAQKGERTTSLDFGHQTNIVIGEVIIGDHEVNGKIRERAFTLSFDKVSDTGKVLASHSEGLWHLAMKYSRSLDNMYTMLCEIADALYYDTANMGDDMIAEFFDELSPEGFDVEKMKTDADLHIFEQIVGKTIQKMVEDTKDLKPLLKIKLTANKDGWINLSNEAGSILNVNDPKELPAIKPYEIKNSEAKSKATPSNTTETDTLNSPIDSFIGEVQEGEVLMEAAPVEEVTIETDLTADMDAGAAPDVVDTFSMM